MKVSDAESSVTLSRRVSFATPRPPFAKSCLRSVMTTSVSTMVKPSRQRRNLREFHSPLSIAVA